MKQFPLLFTLVGLVAGSGCSPSTGPASAIAPVTGGTEERESTVTPATAPASSTESEVTESAAQPKTRRFTFHYQFRVLNLQPMGDTEKDLVRVWLPCPSTTDCQEVARLDATAPAELTEHQEPRYGNPLFYLETRIPASGEFSVDVPYAVVRHEVLQAGAPRAGRKQLSDALRAQFLAADNLVPTTGKPLRLLDDMKLDKEPFVRARQLYEVVDGHVAYQKEGALWGRGDVNWVCDSRFGNCTDFHSLFISLARSQGLPARFEIGFSIPTDKTQGPIAGYHCWAWFHLDDRGWLPVDISEADKHPELKEYYFGNLTADRVMFSIGRDLALVPKSENEPLNFFIFPHIEVGGKVLPKEHVELQFSFTDT